MTARVYAIFGASGGIGTALARILSKKGAVVFLLGRKEEKLKNLSAELSQPYKVLDATDEGAVCSALQSIYQEKQS